MADRVLDDGRPVIWEPQPRQAEFLAAPEDEVLFGGAAGGGKTAAMLVDSLGLNYGAIKNPRHNAIIFRRTFPELAELVAASQDLIPLIDRGAKYNKVDHRWTFSAGGRLTFGYLNTDDDRLKHRGDAFNWIGFEELTLWATSVCYEYLASRNRSTDPTLPCYMRASTNPDGPGQKWVMSRWGISELGEATRIVREVEDERELPDGTFERYMRKVTRRFIPSRLQDNKYLRGSGYLAKLNDLPPEDRDALLLGLWTGNKVKGAYYVNEMAKVRSENRIRKNLPLAAAIPINTFWDLGLNDCNSIWLHQYAAQEHRFPLCYQNSGEWLEFYVEKLRQFAIDRRWTYGTHYLPHDADSRSILSKESAKDQLERLWPGQKFVVVPRIARVIDGINLTRSKFPTCYFDEEGCADGIAALDAYRKKWSRTTSTWLNEPEHDENSHYADAFRGFGQGWMQADRRQVAARPVAARPRSPA